MTSTQWLLQSNHPSLSTIREIERILIDQGNPVHMADLKGRSSEMPDISALDVTQPIICYGPSFVPRAFGHPDLAPGIFFDPATFRWSAFQSEWGADAMLSFGQVTEASEAAALIGRGRAFVRPDEDSKAFDGGLFDQAEMADMINRSMAAGLLRADTTVVVAEPVVVDAEWRMFVVGGEVVAASSYRFAGQGDVGLHVPHPVIDMAFEAADRWMPADVFCLDIALSDGRYGIVEANCFNASRFYGADASAILSSVTDFVAGRKNNLAP